MANPYRGEVLLWVGGLEPDGGDEPRPYTLRFDYAALASLKTGDAPLDPDALVARAMRGDLDVLTALLAAALRRHHPAVSEGAIRAASPPVWPTVAALTRAFQLAYGGVTGGDGEPAEEREHNRPPDPATMRGPRTRSRSAWSQLGRWAFPLAPSGR
jgi:hypothetical protein